MGLIELKNVSKIYLIGDEKKYALNNVSLSLPSSGLVAIIGKSGSGKSTILNMLSLVDKPTTGEIVFDGELTNKWSKKKVNEYHNRCIGIIFQHYHLLEDETGLFNVMLPMMILGKSKKRCEEDAVSLLENMGMKPELYNRKVSEMSGGEKERIGLLRGLTNNPFMILADEPTGALDSNNSVMAMELLKKASKTKLVVVVSHNLKLVESFADRIITLRDGKIQSDTTINETNKGIPRVKEPKFKKYNQWVDQLTKTNLKKRKKINIFSSIALVVGITSSIVITGFNTHAQDAISDKINCHFDYGVSTLSKEVVTEKTDGGISIVKTTRPTQEEMMAQKEKLTPFFVESNYDFLLPSFPHIFYGEKLLEEIQFVPVYSFENSYVDKSLILKGKIPSHDSLDYCVINKSAEKILSEFTKEPLYKKFHIKNEKKVENNANEKRLKDIFVFDHEFQISGVADELDFLSTPKIYFSYLALDNYLSEYLVENLCAELEEEISWKDLVARSNPSDDLSSFSYRLFAKDIKTFDVRNIAFDNKLVLTSNALTISDALSSLINACSMGMDVYLGIAILGTVLIMGIVTYYSYACDRKKSAILSCLGASRSDISSIFVSESLILSIIALLISVLLSIGISALANLIIHSATGFNSVIKIPWESLFGYPYVFPILLLLSVLVVCLASTLLPIAFSKRISIKEELADE